MDEVILDDDVEVGGKALESLFGSLNVEAALESALKEAKTTTSVAKRNKLVKRIKYLKGLQTQGITNPADHLLLRHIPVLPPSSRPVTIQSGNRLEFADVNYLYKDHILASQKMRDLIEDLPPEHLIQERKAMYDGAKKYIAIDNEETVVETCDGDDYVSVYKIR